MFHRVLIWPLIAGFCPFEVFIRKSLLSLLLLDRLKDFLEIKDGLPYLFHSFRNKYFNKISLGNLLYLQNKL